MKSTIQLYSKLLRDLEVELSISQTVDIVLSALIKSVQALRMENKEDFYQEFQKLSTIFQQTEPKFAILIHVFSTLEKNFLKLHNDKQEISSIKKWKRQMIKCIQKIQEETVNHKKAIIEQAEHIPIEGKTILIYDTSNTVYSILKYWKHQGAHFSIIIAEQDFEKTQHNIETMHQLNIPFHVVPSYMLCHVHENIDMVFFGAVTLKRDMLFVMSPGSHSLISEFHLAKIPIYMFINTLKFSNWEPKKRGDTFIHHQKRAHHYKPIEYKRIKYSHDRVPAELFSKIVTNEGILEPESLKKLFQEKFKTRKNTTLSKQARSQKSTSHSEE